MIIGRATTYALCAMAYMAEQEPGAIIRAQDIAAERKLPLGFLLKIFQTLVRHKVVKSRVGRTGGFILAKPASELTALQVVEAIDGALVSRVSYTHSRQMNKKPRAMLEAACDRIAKTAKAELGRIRLSDLGGPITAKSRGASKKARR